MATTLVPFANELSKNFKFVQDMDPKISRSQTFVHWNSISLHDNHANIMCYVHMKYLGTNPISAYAYCDARQSWIKALGGICIYLVIYLVFFCLVLSVKLAHITCYNKCICESMCPKYIHTVSDLRKTRDRSLSRYPSCPYTCVLYRLVVIMWKNSRTIFQFWMSYSICVPSVEWYETKYLTN